MVISSIVLNIGTPLVSSSPAKEKQDISSEIKSLDGDKLRLFSSEEWPLSIDTEISYAIFKILLEIAENSCSNRNRALMYMLKNLNCKIEKKETQINNVVRAFRKYMNKNENQVSEEWLEKIFIGESGQKMANCLGVFSKEKLLQGEIKELCEFDLTNEIFLELCRLKYKTESLAWNEICRFIASHLNFKNVPLTQTIISKFQRLNSRVKWFTTRKDNLSHKKLLNEQVSFKPDGEQEINKASFEINNDTSEVDMIETYNVTIK